MIKVSYVFDIDGTLTPHRSKMLEEHKSFFIEWMKDKSFYLITGSDLPKTVEQLPKEIIANCKTLFCCSGNIAYVPIAENALTLKYKNNHRWDNNLISDCEKYVNNSKHKRRKSINNIEKRVGMLNVSTTGRRISQEEREEYFVWDQEHKEREFFVKFINKTYGEKYEASIGDKISIDIVPKGKNKSQILDDILGKLIFFGDNITDGNDASLALAIKKKKRGTSHEVKDPNDTMNQIKNASQ